MKNIYVLLALLSAPLMAAAACAQSSLPVGDAPRISIATTSTVPLLATKTCTFTFKIGNMTTEGCDFSQPLKNPKFTPVGMTEVKIEFEQVLPTTITSGGPNWITR